MKGKYDDLDFAILREIRKNAKLPIRALAAILGSHPNTIMQRIKRLEKDKIIKKYVAQIDYTALGYNISNLIEIQLSEKGRKDWTILKELKRYPEVTHIYAVTGIYDIMMIAKTKYIVDLNNLLKRINKLPYIVRTETSLILEEIKKGYDYNPFENYNKR